MITRRISYEEPTGPRDGMMKELLSQLLTFDSFPNFAYMMHSSTKIMDRHGATGNSTGNHGSDNEQHQMLISMGFEKDLIQMVLESSTPDTPFDDIINMLSEMGSCGGGQAGSNGGAVSRSGLGFHGNDIVISPRR